MVHALKETWRVLHTTGVLVDLRPRHANQVIELVRDGQAEIIVRYDDDHRVINDVAADEAITKVANAGLFHLEQHVSFAYIKHYDTGSELMNYFQTRKPPVHHAEEIIEKIYRANLSTNTTLRFTNDMQLKCYRKIDQ